MRNLIVSVDSIAAIREDRKEKEPDPVTAAASAELAGADGIAVHVRLDRKHSRDRDLYILRETVKTKLVLYIAPEAEMIERALEVKPAEVTLVPERRDELTTESGLSFHDQADQIRDACDQLKAAGCKVSGVVEPESDALKYAMRLGLDGVELFCHHYRETRSNAESSDELQRLARTAEAAKKHELSIRAAGGLDYRNIVPLLSETEIGEFTVGHCIVSRAVLVGIERAVKEMVDIVKYF